MGGAKTKVVCFSGEILIKKYSYVYIDSSIHFINETTTWILIITFFSQFAAVQYISEFKYIYIYIYMEQSKEEERAQLLFTTI
jgi:hypothetical protein